MQRIALSVYPQRETRQTRVPQEIRLQVGSAAATVANVHIGKDAAKSVIGDDDCATRLTADTKSSVNGPFRSSGDARYDPHYHRSIRRVVDAGRAEMRYDRMSETNPIGHHDIHTNGTPIYEFLQSERRGSHTTKGLRSVNQPCRDESMMAWSAVLRMDQATDVGSLEHVTKTGGVQRSIIMRAAEKTVDHPPRDRK